VAAVSTSIVNHWRWGWWGCTNSGEDVVWVEGGEPCQGGSRWWLPWRYGGSKGTSKQNQQSTVRAGSPMIRLSRRTNFLLWLHEKYTDGIYRHFEFWWAPSFSSAPPLDWTCPADITWATMMQAPIQSIPAYHY